MRIAVIGGGASGLSCAIACARKAERENKNVSITVFEAKDRVGKKILATGNGRCNMMNRNEVNCFFGDSEFVGYALKKFDVESNLDFFASMGLYTKDDSEGRIYPLSNQASAVLDALRFECERLGIIFECSNEISRIKKSGNLYDIGYKYKFDRVVMSCGGKAGVKGFLGYEILKNLGINVISPQPSLTKLTVVDKKIIRPLKGVRHKGVLTLRISGKFISEEKGEVLFADYGLSGIAVMQLSAFVTRSNFRNVTVIFDTVPDFSCDSLKISLEKIKNHNKALKCENLLTGFMPKKLGECILKICNISGADDVAALTDSDLFRIAGAAKALKFEIEGVKGFDDAQVVAGGADTKDFNPRTMESVRHKGLYCIGELLNVDGPCGGYNLWWAWSSGRLCGENLV